MVLCGSRERVHKEEKVGQMSWSPASSSTARVVTSRRAPLQATPSRCSCPIPKTSPLYAFKCLQSLNAFRVLAADHQLSMLQHSFSPSASWTSRKGAGPQIRMVPSSDALASRPGTTGFQLTQLTVRV